MRIRNASRSAAAVALAGALAFGTVACSDAGGGGDDAGVEEPVEDGADLAPTDG